MKTDLRANFILLILSVLIIVRAVVERLDSPDGIGMLLTMAGLVSVFVAVISGTNIYEHFKRAN